MGRMYWSVLIWLIFIISMNTESVINSIYNPKRKSKDLIILPKIFKGEATPPEARAFPRGASRKYNQQNIFKI